VPEAYYTYAEEADDDANKVSQRKRIGITVYLSDFLTGIKTLRLSS
jgi:hypothetical protein